MSRPIFVFDAYGTLFDVHSAVRRHADKIGPKAELLSALWRVKQLEYSFVRTLMGAHRDFEALTMDALFYAAEAVGDVPREVLPELLRAYIRLDAYPDVKPVLSALKQGGARLAILSNGTPDMLSAACMAAGIAPLLDEVFSVEMVGRFKTAPEVYALVTDHYGVEPGAVRFQSSNRWDIAGAARFGFIPTWINRLDQPEEYADLPPHRVLPTLDGLLSPA